MNDAQTIEYFHLVFLQMLQARLDSSRFVLKGGANLRYFFLSHRYSEDIDLDAVGIEPWKLEAKVDEVLASPGLRLLLRTGGLTLEAVTKPKQTSTTQRWKPLVTAEGRQRVRTKIEFSHRRSDPRRVLEPVPERVVAPYALRPPTVLHYTASAAIEQKIEALAHRKETQARDIFDLELLFRQNPAMSRPSATPRTLELALERALELRFGAFENQVSPFLDPEIGELYRSPSAWERIQTYVAERLMEMQS